MLDNEQKDDDAEIKKADSYISIQKSLGNDAFHSVRLPPYNILILVLRFKMVTFHLLNLPTSNTY